MNKGELVRLNVNTCFTKDRGGGLEYPLTNLWNDKHGVVHGTRELSEKERDDWYDELKKDVKAGIRSALDDAGEPKLAPNAASVEMRRDRYYQVLRSRARCYHHGTPMGGMIKLLCLHTGYEFYVKRLLVEKVE